MAKSPHVKIAAAIIKKTSEENPIILDIGANVGLFTKAFMKAPKTPKFIIAIEPSFYVFSILSNNSQHAFSALSQTGVEP